MQEWEPLLRRNLRFIDDLPLGNEFIDWTMGGGTVLRQYYNHRQSKDIDVFLGNPQLFGYFNPKKNDLIDEEADDYDMGNEFIKLTFKEGNIDYIKAQYITDLPVTKLDFGGRSVKRDPDIEIIAKKCNYRTNQFKLRDVFDFACVIDHSRERLVENLEFFIEPADDLMNRIEKLGEFYDDNIRESVDLLPGGEQYADEGYDIVQDFLKHDLKPALD